MIFAVIVLGLAFSITVAFLPPHTPPVDVLAGVPIGMWLMLLIDVFKGRSGEDY